MSTITLEAIQAKQIELAMMVQQLQQGTQIELDGCTINLQPGEHYAGFILKEDGQHMHHLVLMAERPTDDLNWQAAMDWAMRVGGSLPTRQEQALLFANCKPHLKPVWHWSCETHKDDVSFAWGCDFYDGTQDDNHKSYEGGAVAVRRV